jgi:aryl-alcohol dehydrogenase-like predicted oxidoreductase
MNYRRLGATGVQISALGLGTMMLGSWGNPDHDEGVRVIHRAVDAGINFIDTADVYASGESEEIVGKALAGGLRDDVVLATKFHQAMGDGPNDWGSSRRWITRAVDASLRRLQTDWIDLYQVHRWDPHTAHDETLGALTDLVHAGKIRSFGSSGYPAAQIVTAQWIARDRGYQRYVSEQPSYSILNRAIEADVLPVCLEHRMAAVVWSPLAGGWLSGRWRTGSSDLTSPRAGAIPAFYDLSVPANRAKLAAADALAELADEAGVSLIHLALAFAINHPAVTSAIIGPRSMEQLDGLLGADGVVLEPAVLDRIDEIVSPGMDVNPDDVLSMNLANPALAPAARRR